MSIRVERANNGAVVVWSNGVLEGAYATARDAADVIVDILGPDDSEPAYNPKDEPDYQELANAPFEADDEFGGEESDGHTPVEPVDESADAPAAETSGYMEEIAEPSADLQTFPAADAAEEAEPSPGASSATTFLVEIEVRQREDRVRPHQDDRLALTNLKWRGQTLTGDRDVYEIPGTELDYALQRLEARGYQARAVVEEAAE